jgi:hypothetical protein
MVEHGAAHQQASGAARAALYLYAVIGALSLAWATMIDECATAEVAVRAALRRFVPAPHGVAGQLISGQPSTHSMLSMARRTAPLPAPS